VEKLGGGGWTKIEGAEIPRPRPRTATELILTVFGY